MKYGTEPLGKINELGNIGEEKDVFFCIKKSKSFYWMIVHFNMYYLLYYKLQ